MNPEDRLTELLHSHADSYRPGDGREAIQHRARVLRRTRAARRIAVPLLAAAVVGGFAIAATNSGPSRHVTVNMPVLSTTVPQAPKTTTSVSAAPTTTTPATTSTTTGPGAASNALAAYLAAHPDAVAHSGVVYEGGRPVAVVGLEPNPAGRSVVVLDLSSARATVLAQLPLPAPYYDLIAKSPIADGDVTGDGMADFLVIVSAADNQPGVVVSDDGGSWRLVPAAPITGGAVDPANVYVGRSPSFSGAWLQSTYNDCIPYCAAGHTSTLTWLYDRGGRYFRSVPSSALLQTGYYSDGPTGTPRYDLIISRPGGAAPGSSVSGWLFFIYQDGRVSVLGHFTASARGDGTMTFVTDTTSQPFPFAYQSPGSGQAGGIPIDAGQSFAGTYSSGTITLAGCQTYLYWANAAHSPIAESCTFGFRGPSVP